MKLKSSTILLILLYLMITSCDGQEKNYTNKESQIIKDTMRIEMLKKQLKNGAPSDFDVADYDEKDFEVTIPILKKKLLENGFRFLDEKSFDLKIKYLFGRTIDNNASSRYLFINFFTKCNFKIFYHPNSADIQGTFVLKNEKFITDFYALPQILDYQKEYPQLKPIEDVNVVAHDAIENVDKVIKHWKEIPDLSEQRQKNFQLLLARNKYLFNDDQSQLLWLWKNDRSFLENLVKVFGYTEDRKLLQLVFNDTPPYILRENDSDPEDFGKLLWHQECNGKMTVNQNTLNFIEETTSIEHPEYLAHLSDYLIAIGQSYYEKNKEHGRQFKEIAKVIAQLLSFGQNICIRPEFAEQRAVKGMPRTMEKYKNLMIKNFLGVGDGNNDFYKEFQLNNFYNIPHLKEWCEKANNELEKEQEEYDKKYG